MGNKGTHTSRTMMFDDLCAVLDAAPTGSRGDYLGAITEGNCLGKPTAATRRLSAQRLSELYALDPEVAVFRVLRRLWQLDAEPGRRLLALLCAIARDPLLAATADPILSLAPGDEFLREPMRQAIREVVGERLNDAILDKVVRNAASSWTQAGHLEGRTFKKRRAVKGSGPSAGFALYLAYTAGFRGAELFTSGWFRVLDAASSRGFDLAIEGKRLGLLDLRMAGEVVDVNLDRLDPTPVRR
jgi:hypothetical protein